MIEFIDKQNIRYEDKLPFAAEKIENFSTVLKTAWYRN